MDKNHHRTTLKRMLIGTALIAIGCGISRQLPGQNNYAMTLRILGIGVSVGAGIGLMTNRFWLGVIVGLTPATCLALFMR